MKQLNLLKTLFLLCALMVGSSSVWAADTWEETTLAALTSSDVFVIVGTNSSSSYAMTNNNGTSSAPGASEVTIADGKITSTVADNIKWNISGNAEDGYVFYPNGDSEKWLYCTNSNNGVRVGTNSNKTFKITDSYPYNTATSRYVGIYDSQDWRCYTSINANIKNQTFSFYKLVADSKTAIATIGDLSPMEIAEGAEGAFTVGITDAAGTYSVSYTSSDDNILMIDNGDYLAIAKGNVTVTVTVTPDNAETYKAVSKEFSVRVYDPNVGDGTLARPYSVAEARAAIDAGTGVTGVYAKGIVSEIVTEYSEIYHNISYNISADGEKTGDQLQSFRGKGFSGADFTSSNDIKVGDEVLLYGNLTKYSSTYEFAADNQLVTRKTEVASVTAAGYATYVATANMEFDEGDAFAVVIDGGVAKLNGVTKVKTNTPVLLKGAGAKRATLFEEAPAAITTDLKVSNGGEPTNAYVLANKTHGVGFYKWAGGSLTSGKVYLDASTSAHELEFIGFDGESGDVTGISEIETMRNGENEKFFNLAGQRVAQPQKGLYIVNGKKVIIK